MYRCCKLTMLIAFFMCGSELTRTYDKLAGDNGNTCTNLTAPQFWVGWFVLEPLFIHKVHCNTFLVTLNDVTSGAIKEDRNYSSFVTVGLAEWADTAFMLFLCGFGAA